MIRRLLCWIADYFADSAWLHDMRRSEVQANRSATRIERRIRKGGNPIADAAFKPRPKGDRQ